MILSSALNKTLPWPPTSRVLELGELHLERLGAPYGFRLKDCMANQFQSWVTVDLGSGSDDVENVDLAEPAPNWNKQYDIIIDGGTVEHVEPATGQYQCWSNIHEWLALNGMAILTVAEPGTWPNHCRYRYPREFFDSFERIGYGVHYEAITFPCSSSDNLFVILTKMREEVFMTEHKFWELVDYDNSPITPHGNYPKGKNNYIKTQ